MGVRIAEGSVALSFKNSTLSIQKADVKLLGRSACFMMKYMGVTCPVVLDFAY